ncbi:MAG: DUF2671 domain-containing protein [Rickettsiales endosymbiont of Dermacentor nuttalli]
MQLLKDIGDYLVSDKAKDVDDDSAIYDVRYACRASVLINESLQKGCDVMQLPNGDIVVTEKKTFTFQYTWDDKKGKLVRVQSANRVRKLRTKKKSTR